MIITQKFIDFMENGSKEDQMSVYNHAVYTCASLRFLGRLSIAVEILLGKRFCLWLSRKQKSETKPIQILEQKEVNLNYFNQTIH